jgi:UDP-N-acetyl-D-mannosaminuronate dehydrogenase
MPNPSSSPGSSAVAGMPAREPATKTETSTEAAVLVVGLGEIGGPLLKVLGEAHHAAGRDIEDRPFDGVQVLHLCFPYSSEFVSHASRYVSLYEPGVVVVHSTVVPGTTSEIQEKTGVPAVYSPVRGKHVRMTDELRRYRKFVAGTSSPAVALVEDHFAAAGIPTQRMSSPEALELAKLLETTYFGVLVAWAQEMDRFAEAVDADYWETIDFFAEIDYLPPVSFQPGYIGGHCVMPNLELLEQVRRSPFIDVMRESNRRRAREWQDRGLSTADRLSPRSARRQASVRDEAANHD